MNLTFLPLAMGKIEEQTTLFNLGMATGPGEGNFWSQTNCRPGRDEFHLAILAWDTLREKCIHDQN